MTPNLLDCPYCDAPLDPALEACPACQGSLWIAGRYRIESMRGRGDHSAVYSALRHPDQLRVAVKVLSLSGGDWKSAEQFERGAQALQGLRHRCLPEAHELVRDETFGRLLLVREYLDDDTLEERVRAARHIDAASYRTLLVELLELARYLHGLVPMLLHRDIRPANIMFRSRDSWQPVLVDFDAMSAPERGDDTLHLAGTSSYASHEQLAGGAVPASDLYSIGLTMVFVATHLAPDALRFEHGRFQLDGMLDALEPEVRALVLRLVERDPAARPASAAEALAMLEPARGAAPTLAAPRHVPAAEMAPHELEARVAGWLALGEQGERNARLLVPYLARLDPIGYARFRDDVARRGGIAAQVLDASVEEERRRIAPAPPVRRRSGLPLSAQSGRAPMPQRHRHRRQPGSAGAGGVLAVLFAVSAVGVGVSFQAVQLRDHFAEQFGLAPDDSPTAGACDVDWLSVGTPEPDRHCLLWGEAQGDLVSLGCAARREPVEHACLALTSMPNASPQTIDAHGAMAVLATVEALGLGPVPSRESLLEGTRAIPFGSDVRIVTPEGPPGGGAPPADDAPEPFETVELQIVSEPAGAQLEIEGKAVCTTPCTVNVAHGERPTMVVSLPGHAPITRRVYALSDKEVRFELERR